jgi:hypothetical protein
MNKPWLLCFDRGGVVVRDGRWILKVPLWLPIAIHRVRVGDDTRSYVRVRFYWRKS